MPGLDPGIPCSGAGDARVKPVHDDDLEFAVPRSNARPAYFLGAMIGPTNIGKEVGMTDQAYVRAETGSPVLEALQELLGERITTSMAVREHHGRGEDYFKPIPSDAVCFPHSTEEVSEIVKICAANHTPIIPFGTGTSLEGHVTAPHGGITIDMSQMNDVLEVNAEDLDCRVQAGVTRKQLNEYLRDTGLMFPDRPGRGRVPGRDDRDPGEWHQRRALRHHERECSWSDSGHGRRPDCEDRWPGQEIICGV